MEKNPKVQEIINQIKETTDYKIELVFFDWRKQEGLIHCDKRCESEVFQWLREHGANPYNTRLSFDWYKIINFNIPLV